MFQHIRHGNGCWSLERQGHMSISRRGSRKTSFPSQILGNQRCRCLRSRSGCGELNVDHANKCLVVGNACSGEDGTVEGVGTFAEGHDGRAVSTRGVVRASDGRLASVGCCVDLICEGNLSIRRSLPSLHTSQILRLLHIPLLKRTLGDQKRCHECRILPRGSKSHSHPPSSRTRPNRGSHIFQTTQNECGRESTSGFEREVPIGDCGTCLGGTLVRGTGVGVGEG
mmetsp:Transcript_7176/g.12877  ORF Transcript_7176/g.12877 Transcript_7176/m.12877 type:complete len:226 (+) Transcript_7176:671-1348(+)